MLLAPVKHKKYIRFLYLKGGDYPITFHSFIKKEKKKKRKLDDERDREKGKPARTKETASHHRHPENFRKLERERGVRIEEEEVRRKTYLLFQSFAHINLLDILLSSFIEEF